MNTLKAMIDNLDTVEVSKTVVNETRNELEGSIVERRINNNGPITMFSPSETEEDDLQKIEGIGPKIESILKDSGVTTYEELSHRDAEDLRNVLLAAGNRYKMHNPTSWPQQAKFAAKGMWDALEDMQDQLNGGV
jgi:predicted flap endonuclease-1-like 5' DNA nuclease